jgi:hypothetical protein
MAFRKVNLRQDRTKGKVSVKYLDSESVSGFTPTTDINISDGTDKFWSIEILKQYLQTQIQDKKDVIIGNSEPVNKQ